MSTDTPQTDAVFKDCPIGGDVVQLTLDLSRQLERELTAETEKVKMLREALQKVSNEVGFTAGANDWPKLHNVGIIALATLEATK